MISQDLRLFQVKSCKIMPILSKKFTCETTSTLRRNTCFFKTGIFTRFPIRDRS